MHRNLVLIFFGVLVLALALAVAVTECETPHQGTPTIDHTSINGATEPVPSFNTQELTSVPLIFMRPAGTTSYEYRANDRPPVNIRNPKQLYFHSATATVTMSTTNGPAGGVFNVGILPEPSRTTAASGTCRKFCQL